MLVECCAFKNEEGVAGAGGPLDGYQFDVNPKRIPQAVQFRLNAKSLKRTVFCVYDWEPEQLAMVYSGSFDEDPKLPFSDDACGRPYLEVVGTGVVYSVWKTVSEIRKEQE